MLNFEELAFGLEFIYKRVWMKKWRENILFYLSQQMLFRALNAIINIS